MTLTVLPDIKTQFTEEYFNPVKKEFSRFGPSSEAAFEEAKERYEARHGHKFPYAYRTWLDHFYKTLR